MEEAVNYYLHRINTEKKTGYMFGFMPFPTGSPMMFTIVNVVLFALIGIYFKAPLSMLPFLLTVTWEHYIMSYQRNILFDDCMASEALMQNEFKTKGADPNFPLDPLYVTKSDREEIFDECEEWVVRGSLVDKLKSHQAFILILVASYIVAYFLLKNLVI
ncbi:MAG: hypothetical protein EBW68_01295 [Actinobacteria bacterium]|nr:hypothetical protein [Actinomycetota bacterium]